MELLLVLSVVMIIGGVSFYSFQNHHDKRQLDAFMGQLEKDFFYAQKYAMAHNRVTSVIFLENSYQVNGQSTLLERYFHENIQITFLHSSRGNRVEFNGNGNIRRFGRIEVRYNNQTYTVVFQMGRGRFYYE